jgi:CyaY protein
MTDRHSFVERSRLALERIESVLGDLEHEDLDPHLAGDVLTLAFSDGTRYVINAHSAAAQIWMAAGTSAWHFDWDEARGRWIAAKSGDELMAVTAAVVSRKLGVDVAV